MRQVRKIWLLHLLFVATLFVQTASATYYLPEGRYENSNWQDRSICEQKESNVRTDFAVCDTEALRFANEAELCDQFDIADQYFYSCEIFKRGDYIRDETIYLGILDIGGQRSDEALNKSDTSFHSDCSRTVAPTPQHRNTQRLWGRIHDVDPIY